MVEVSLECAGTCVFRVWSHDKWWKYTRLKPLLEWNAFYYLKYVKILWTFFIIFSSSDRALHPDRYSSGGWNWFYVLSDLATINLFKASVRVCRTSRTKLRTNQEFWKLQCCTLTCACIHIHTERQRSHSARAWLWLHNEQISKDKPTLLIPSGKCGSLRGRIILLWMTT